MIGYIAVRWTEGREDDRGTDGLEGTAWIRRPRKGILSQEKRERKGGLKG